MQLNEKMIKKILPLLSKEQVDRLHQVLARRAAEVPTKKEISLERWNCELIQKCWWTLV
jgi:hypothetical protein